MSQHRGSKLFQGELMKCRECEKRFRSDPKKSSNWTAIQLDDRIVYICPTCWDEIMDGKRKPKVWGK